MHDQTDLITRFTHELGTLCQRLATLRISEATTRISATTLQDTLDKLQTAEEELHQQRDELTATHQAEEAMRARYAALFAQAPDAYLVTDATGRIQEVNQAAAALLGVPCETLVGKPLLVYITQADRKAFHTQLARLRTQARVQDWELSLQPWTGPPIPVSITIAVDQRSVEPLHTLLWLIRDVTARKYLEDNLRRAEHLALLGKLAAGVAHEIRNPLAALFLQTDVLEEECQRIPGGFRALLTVPLAAIKTELRHLHDLVEDYLSLARLQRLERVPTPLSTLVTACAQEVQARCVAQGITLWLEGVDQLGVLSLHQNTFRRALHNLVQNAIDAMPAGGMLTLRGHRTATQLLLAVCDTGGGIPPAQLPFLFTPLRVSI